MKINNTLVDFEILIDDFFLNINKDPDLEPIENKKVLSIINDFQDGNWRYNKFQAFIWDNIAETALSYKERTARIDRPGSTLVEAAKKIRLTDSNKSQDGQGSEIAEIVLYGIMKHHYKALPVVPKIFYKQNSQDYAKGADSVHIVIEENDKFSIWFGEAKFYTSIDDDRLYKIVDSIESSLNTKKLEKENSIITNVSDLDLILGSDSEIYNNIINIIKTGTSIDILKPIIHIPILLLHECEITENSNELSDLYKKRIIDSHQNRARSYFKKQINKLKSRIFKYSEIHFHLILFPVPKKELIVNSFIENVTHLKKQD